MARTRAEEMGVATENGNRNQSVGRPAYAPAGGGAPRLPIRPRLDNVKEEKDTSQQGNAKANIAAGYKQKVKSQVAAEIKSEVASQTVKSKPGPAPVMPLVIPANNILPPPVLTQDIGVQSPMLEKSDTVLRPDGITEVLGPGGIVLEEIGEWRSNC